MGRYGERWGDLHIQIVIGRKLSRIACQTEDSMKVTCTGRAA